MEDPTAIITKKITNDNKNGKKKKIVKQMVKLKIK
jgi:hypothetical protein